MRTIITIDVDSDRTPQINLSKPVDLLEDVNSDSLKEIIMNDIVAVIETLCLLSESAIEKGYIPKESLVKNLNKRINQI